MSSVGSVETDELEELRLQKSTRCCSDSELRVRCQDVDVAPPRSYPRSAQHSNVEIGGMGLDMLLRRGGACY